MRIRALQGTLIGIIVIIAASMAVYFFPYLEMAYGRWRFNRLVVAVQDERESEKQAVLLEANNDTYGGETPEETLMLYSRALENKEYEVASRYFIQEKQAEEFMNFLGADVYALEAYLALVKKIGAGEYDASGTFYTARVELDGPDFFARLRKYPNNLWKIIEL